MTVPFDRKSPRTMIMTRESIANNSTTSAAEAASASPKPESTTGSGNEATDVAVITQLSLQIIYCVIGSVGTIANILVIFVFLSLINSTKAVRYKVSMPPMRTRLVFSSVAK